MEGSDSLRSTSEIGLDTIQSVESTVSQIEPEQGRFTTPPDPTSSSASTSVISNVLPFGDIISVIIVCTQHHKMALTLIDPSKGLWFPCSVIKRGQTYVDCLKDLLLRVLLKVGFKDPILVHQMRLQTTKSMDFVTRLLYLTEIVPGTPDAVCCTTNPLLTWMSYLELVTLPNLWGTEPISYAHYIATYGFLPDSSGLIEEITVKQVLDYFAVPEIKQEMLRLCGCTGQDMSLLYSEFHQHCYPSRYMNLHSFSRYLDKSGLALASDDAKLDFIFRAFSPELAGYVDLFQFISGLAAIDPQLSHGGAIGRERFHYIYGYYHRSDSAPSSSNFDIRSFAQDLLTLNNEDHVSLEDKVASLYSTMGLQNESSILEDAFARVVGTLQVRGTSRMFRAPKSPFVHIKSNPLYDPDMKPAIDVPDQGKQFAHASHQVRILRDGTIGNHRINHTARGKHLNNKNETVPAAMLRKRSNDLFSKNLFTDLIEAIRTYNQRPHNSDWLKNSDKWAKKMLSLCDSAKELLAKETRVLKVDSPVFVLGDIHGNLHDLMVFASVLWPGGPAVLTANYLFLGDYVDRGNNSVECISYLLCLKMLAPNRFHLLRGNHEIREIQQNFTFRKECFDKFGWQGDVLWERFNQVFDVMPVCALVDSKIFCAHGGIPTSAIKMEKVEASIPCPMPEPERQSQVAWQMLWNDPIGNREYNQLISTRNRRIKSRAIKLPAGFIDNIRRDTAYYFTQTATDNFLAANNLSHVIRGHELKPNGFCYHHGGRVITVFSCSKYCNQANEAAVILVGDDAKIRPIKVDTK